MSIRLIAIGTKMPAWITQGFDEYAKRLPKGFFELCEIPAEKHTKTTDTARIIEKEGEKILSLITPSDFVIALDVAGTHLATEELSSLVEAKKGQFKHISFLIGGAFGLSKSCLVEADFRLSLSSLTLPHPLVRVVFIEQLYRIFTLSQGHPYHK